MVEEVLHYLHPDLAVIGHNRGVTVDEVGHTHRIQKWDAKEVLLFD